MSVLWDKAKSFVSRLLQPLFDYMAPTVTETLFPQEPTSVKAYESTVFGTYITGGEDHEAADHYTVKEIRLYKCRSHPFHEYVIAQVTCRNQKSAHYLRIERTRSIPRPNVKEEEFLNSLPLPLAQEFRAALGEATLEETDEVADPDPVEENSYPPAATPSSTSSQTGGFQWNSVSHSSDSLKNLSGKPAVDTVMSVKPDSFRNDEQLDVLHTKDFPLARLACLARIVNEEGPIYNLFRHQCYWYANLITKVIEKEAKINSRGIARNGDNSLIGLRLVRSTRGAWWRIPVGKVEKKLVETISAKFEEAWGKRLTTLANGISGWTNVTDGDDGIVEDPTVAELRAMLAEEQRKRQEERKKWEATERQLRQALQQQPRGSSQP